MKEAIVPFFRTVGVVNSGVFERDTLIRHAVALAIAVKSPLPTAPVESTEAAYNSHARIPAEEQIAEFNEVSPLNVLATANLVRAYWLSRYNAAFGTLRVFVGMDFLASLSGVGQAISPEDLKALNENAGDFELLYTSALRTVDALNNQNAPV